MPPLELRACSCGSACTKKQYFASIGAGILEPYWPDWTAKRTAAPHTASLHHGRHTQLLQDQPHRSIGQTSTLSQPCCASRSCFQQHRRGHTPAATVAPGRGRRAQSGNRVQRGSGPRRLGVPSRKIYVHSHFMRPDDQHGAFWSRTIVAELERGQDSLQRWLASARSDRGRRSDSCTTCTCRWARINLCVFFCLCCCNFFGVGATIIPG